MMSDPIALSASPVVTTNRPNPQDDRAAKPDTTTFASVIGGMTESAVSSEAKPALAKSLNTQDGEPYPADPQTPGTDFGAPTSADRTPELPAPAAADSILPLPQFDPNLPIPVIAVLPAGVAIANDPVLTSRELPLAGISARFGAGGSASAKPGMTGKPARAEQLDGASKLASTPEAAPESSAQSFAADLAKNLDDGATLLSKELPNTANLNTPNLPAQDATAGPSGDLASTALTRPATLAIDAQLPLHSPRFAESFAQQVTVLVDHGIQTARISLNPPDLGPIDVRITLQQDEATVHFASQHVIVREALSDALPRLRELLEQSGVRLNDSGVFAQLPQREHAADQPGPRTPELGANLWSPPTDPALTTQAEMRALRLVDAYV